MKRAITKLLLGVLWVAGAFLAWREFEPLILFRPVQAEVISADVVQRTVTSSRPNHPGTRRTRSGYVPDVTYRYDVKGVTYVSAQYNRTGTLESGRKARQRMQRLIHNQTVTAWYNPFNPGDAVLGRAPNFILLTILAAAWFMGWLFSVASRRAIRPTRPADKLFAV